LLVATRHSGSPDEVKGHESATQVLLVEVWVIAFGALLRSRTVWTSNDRYAVHRVKWTFSMCDGGLLIE
jgi:hypothetical protein